MGYLQRMVNTQNQRANITNLGSGSHAKLLESLMNLSVSVVILLFTVKSTVGYRFHITGFLE